MPEASELDCRFSVTCSESENKTENACLEQSWCQTAEMQAAWVGRISSFLFPQVQITLSSFNCSTPERKLQRHLYSSQHWEGKKKFKKHTKINQRTAFVLKLCSVPVIQRWSITQSLCSRIFQYIPSGVKKTTDEKRNPSTSPISNIQSRTEPNLHQLATSKSPPIIPATAVKIRRTGKTRGKILN